MPFDDDDDPTLAAAPGQLGAPGAVPDDAEDALEDEAQQDFRLFAQSLSGNNSKTKTSGRTLRRGEKDFEAHGTRAQDSALEASRDAMHDVLAYTRAHKPSGYLRGWYFPDRWAHVPSEENAGGEEEDSIEDEGNDTGNDGDPAAATDKKNKKKASPGMFTRDRVVVLDLEASLPLFKSMGRVVTGLEKGAPAWGKTWLLPEEALHLVERGSLDLWWPTRGLEEIFPQKNDGADSVLGGSNVKVASDDEPDYDLGIPLSLQAAYSLFIGQEGERGKISLEKYQVYANLRRTGYTVLRATPTPLAPSNSASLSTSPPTTLWQWLVSLFNPRSPDSSTSTPPTNPPPYGPLVKPGLYRSYKPLFAQLAIIPRHEPKPDTQCYGPAQEPFRIYYHVWKSAPGFTKSHPPPPDFRIAVVDARESSVPTLQQLTALVESTPWDPPPAATAPRPRPPQNANKDNNNINNSNGNGTTTPTPAQKPNTNSTPYNPNMSIGLTYKRLKHGWRNAIVAVVDRGLISYLRFGEMAFAHERLFERFDGGSRGGGKRGGGRSGRGGRGRGRGRGRGGRGRGG